MKKKKIRCSLYNSVLEISFSQKVNVNQNLIGSQLLSQLSGVMKRTWGLRSDNLGSKACLGLLCDYT